MFYHDTWLWTGTTWQRLHPAASPPARDNADMVYDAATQTVILFGSYDGSYLGDTWSWNGSTWTQLAPVTSPGEVTTAWQAAYDAATRQVLLFGGDLGPGTLPQNQTWAWDGTTWTQLTPATSPPGRAYGSMAYDNTADQVLLFGGYTNTAGTKFSSTTWGWDGTTWQKIG